jgi:hypothetical protein
MNSYHPHLNSYLPILNMNSYSSSIL